MRKAFIGILLTLCLFPSSVKAFSQTPYRQTKAFYNDSILGGKKRILRAASTAAGLNLGIWAFDRYALKADFAYIDFESVANNFRTGFVWDNDLFPTNLFAHPYHGGMYFNAGRTNGLNFWQSIPIAVGGSAMWELFMENQPPSMNDIIATPIGGMIVGEMGYRLSSAVLDCSTTGIERVGRELLGAVLNPISAVNRIIDGSMWKVGARNYSGSKNYPILYSIGTGMRFISEGKALFKGGLNPYIKATLAYGDPFDSDNDKPFDYFTVSTLINVGGNQPLFSSINARGLLWGTSFDTSNNQEMLLGIFQHFNYFDSKSTVKNSDLVPYQLAETASFGVGTIYNLQSPSKKATAVIGLHLSGILLGGSLSDVYHVGNREYNIGSGFTTKVLSLVRLANIGTFNLTGDFYQLYTWKGYPLDIDWENVDDYYLNAQGDESSTRMAVICPNLSLNVTQNFSIVCGADFYLRETIYKHYPTARHSSFEMRIGGTFIY